jgi:hypothetical protein
VYPEHQHVWQLRELSPKGFWKDTENHRAFFDRLAKKFNIQQPDDWYRVTARMVAKEGGHFINSQYKGSLIRGFEI